MARPLASSVLSALGLGREEERLHSRALPLSGSTTAVAAAALQVDVAELPDLLRPLLNRGYARIARGVLHVASLSEVVARELAREAEESQRAQERLGDLATAIPFLAATTTRPRPGDHEEIAGLDGELSRGGNPLQLLTTLVEQTRGDLLWLRPDTWQMPRESAVAALVGAAIASGRRSRAVYPVRALQDAPDVLRARAQVGEQVRVTAELPTRLVVIGKTHAVVPEPLGMADEPRLLVRQPALVEALGLWFELIWERSAPVPELDLGDPRPDLRRFLLQQLAAGAKDEQIARTLGISLRTVRRRVADILIELGVDSRFQAGVEAVRRGWL